LILQAIFINIIQRLFESRFHDLAYRLWLSSLFFTARVTGLTSAWYFGTRHVDDDAKTGIRRELEVTPLFTLNPRAIVWLCWIADPFPSPSEFTPAFTFVLTFKARTAV